jgi:hypothetical protein
LPYEKCIDKYDISSGLLNELIFQEEEEVYDFFNKPVIAVKTITYTMDKIVKEYVDFGGQRIIGKENTIIDNPFKDLEIFPVFVFESITEEGKPLS